MWNCTPHTDTHTRTSQAAILRAVPKENVANEVVTIETMSEKTVFMEKACLYLDSILNMQSGLEKAALDAPGMQYQPGHTSNAPGVPLLLLGFQMRGPEMWTNNPIYQCYMLIAIIHLFVECKPCHETKVIPCVKMQKDRCRFTAKEQAG